jgi:signal peptidase I
MKAVLDRDVPFRFEARGTSMAPFIRNGDIVTVRPARERPLLKGDVVAFAEPSTNKLCVHRIIRASGGRYAVKGDNVPNADGVIPGSCIVGVVAKVERGGRKISLGVGRGRALIADMSRIGALPVTGRRAVGVFLRILRRRKTK